MTGQNVFSFFKRWAYLLTFAAGWAPLAYGLMQGEIAYASWSYPPLLGLLHAIFSLVAIWMSVSTCKWWWRMPVGLATIAAIYFSAAWAIPFGDGPDNEFFFAYPTSSTFLVAWIIRQIFGPVGPASVPKLAAFRFSLSQACLWTAFVAVFIAIAKSRSSGYAAIKQIWPYFYMCSAALVCSTMTVPLLYLKRRNALFISPIVCLLCICASLASGFAIHFALSPELLWHFGSIGGTQAIIMVTTILLYRWSTDADDKSRMRCTEDRLVT